MPRISPCSFRGGSDSASRSFEVELEVELEVEKVKCRTPLYPHPLSPPSTHFALIYLSTISHTENTATSPPLHLSIHQSCAPMKEKGFRLAQSNGQKNGFATGISHWKRKASSTEQTLAFPSRAKSFEQRRLHRCCLLCALHAGACFRLGATTTTIWRFSSAADPQTIYFFFIPPLPLSIVKKESFRLSLLPLWVATPFVSAFHFASLSFPPRKSSSLAPSFDGARWC